MFSVSVGLYGMCQFLLSSILITMSGHESSHNIYVLFAETNQIVHLRATIIRYLVIANNITLRLSLGNNNVRNSCLCSMGRVCGCVCVCGLHVECTCFRLGITNYGME